MKNVTQTLLPRAQQRLVSKLQTSLTSFALAALAAGQITATAQAAVIDDITIADGVYSIPEELVVDAGTVTISPSGVFDLRDNALIVRTSPFNQIYGYVVNGYNGGAWNGTGGINSSTAANDSTHLTALGIINNAEAHYTMFEGIALGPAAESLVKYTYYGDAELDGDVDLADFLLMGTGFGWYHGDFNYSGTVDAADYALFLASYQAVGTGPLPEPGSVALMVTGAASLLLRRRTRPSA